MAANAADLLLSTTLATELGVAASAKTQRIVTAASLAIARFCGRTFEKGTAIVEYPPGFGRPLLLLDRTPILSITSIEERGGVLDSEDYEIVASGGAEMGAVRRIRGVWMDTRSDAGRITVTREGEYGLGGSDGIKITYAAGYVTPGQNSLLPATYPTVSVPEDLQEAALLVAMGLYKRIPMDPNLAAESLGDWSVTYRGEVAKIVDGVIAEMLAPYRSFRVS